MKKINYSDDWPNSWKASYPYDLLEIYGQDSVPGYAYAYQQRQLNTLALIQKVAKPGAKVLDLAAAQGNFSLRLAELGYEVTWNDLREDLIDYVKLKHEHGSIHFLPGNIFEIAPKSQFDVVLLAEVIEHVAHPDKLLRQVSKLVRPGGHIVMTTPNGEYFGNTLPKFSNCPNPSQFEAIQFRPNSDGHIFLLHLDEIENIAKQAGLKIEQMCLFTNSLTNGHVKLHLLLKILPKKIIDGAESLSQKLPVAIRRKLSVGMACLLGSIDN